MKITLDHNCLIDLATGTPTGANIRALIAEPAHEPYVVNIGASEMRERGIRPDRYDLFEQLLSEAGVAHATRLNPALIWDLTFWDRCVWTSPEDTKLIQDIDAVLFGDSDPVDPSAGLDSPNGRKWLNRICDVQTLWCHIRNGNDLLVTSDRNFMKQTKLPRLLSLGAGAIRSPFQQ
jgi:hypothetical protein